jgi:ATP-binding protein involved in chromosome partitioning
MIVSIVRPGQGPRLARDFGIRFLGELPFDPRLARSGDSGIPFVAIHQETMTGRMFQAMARELSVAIGLEPEGHIERGKE